MADCEHCWHGTHQLTTNPPINCYVCCYCGDTKREQWNPAKGHGPHHPLRSTALPVQSQNTAPGDLVIRGNTSSNIALRGTAHG